jgi:hypothetical protein
VAQGASAGSCAVGPLSQFYIDALLRPMGGHALEPGPGIACHDGFADLEPPIPQTGLALNKAEFNALGVHDFGRGEVSLQWQRKSFASLPCLFRDQAAVANFMRDSLAAFLIQPGLGHRTFDDVPLNPAALRTCEGPQVLAGVTRLNRRQPHRGAASGTLGALVLCVEHGATNPVL